MQPYASKDQILDQLFYNPERALELLVQKFEQWYEQVILILPNFIVAIFIFIGFILLGSLLKKLTARLLYSTTSNPEITRLLSNIVHWMVLIAGFFFSLGILELDKTVTSLLAGVGILGLAISFAFQNLATNFVSGIILASRRPISAGDIIESNDYYGTVRIINWRTTHLLTPEGQYVHIPNKEVIDRPVVNYTKLGKRRVDLEVGISYAEDLDHVKQVTLNAIEQVESRMPEAPPEFFYEEFGDSSINFVARFWILFTKDSKNQDYKKAVSDAVINMKKPFEQEGITFHGPLERWILE